MGKMEYSRKFSALMELNFLISSISMFLGSTKEKISPKIRLMEQYPYMANGNIFDTVCDGYKMQ